MGQVFVQVALVGLVCFCEPGLYNAIVSMAGGIDDPELVATSNMIVYLTFSLSSILAPAIINRIGARWALTFGTVGYWVYVSSLYFYSSAQVGGWVVNLAAVAIGWCAGPLWTAQNALCLSYPTPETKGRYFAVFWIVFNLGGVVGGAISFATNFSSSASTASGSTFLFFIALMIGGSVLASTLVEPTKVKRPNGKPVEVASLPDWKEEALATLRLFRHREMLLLTPLFAYTGWFYPYQFSVFNAGLFNARTQGFNNIFYWGAQMLGSHWIGSFLDEAGVRKSVKAVQALKVLAVAITSTWLLGMYFNESRSLTSSRDIHVPDAGFEEVGVGAAGGASDSAQSVWELNQCAEPQAELTAGGDYALRLGWSGHVYGYSGMASGHSGVLPQDCWAAISLPLQRSQVGVAYRISFAAKDWEADGVQGTELIVQADGVDLLHVVPPSHGEFQRFSTVFQPFSALPGKQHSQAAEGNEAVSTNPVLRFSVGEGTVVVDDIKVEREGLDVFGDFWLSCGPLTLYIVWGFLDAFIQNYVCP